MQSWQIGEKLSGLYDVITPWRWQRFEVEGDATMTQLLAAEEGEQPRLLAAVGLTDAEEHLYLTLIDHAGGTAADVAAQLHVPRSRARTLLASLASERDKRALEPWATAYTVSTCSKTG